MSRSKCGLGVMARAPSVGKTRLAAHLPPARLDALRTALLSDTLAAVAGAGDEIDEAVIFFTPPGADSQFATIAPHAFARVAQVEGDLGRRMRAAFDDLLVTRRCGAALLVGSDIPFLTAEILITARDTVLATGGVVLGPADDGGYYLIGMSAPHAALFEGIEWSTPNVLAGTLRAAERHGIDTCLVVPAYDIDTIDDLRRAEHDLAVRPNDVSPRLREWFLR